MRAELDRIGCSHEKVEWLDGIRPASKGQYPSIGALGNVLSHLAALAWADDRGLERFLILEDDVDFVADFTPRMNVIVDHLRSQPWDIFYGGGLVEERLPLSRELATIDPAVSVGGAHFIGFRGGVMRPVHDYIAAQLDRPEGDPAGGPMFSDGSYSWARRELSLRTLIANPDVGHQRSSRSDITPKRWDDLPGVREAATLMRQVRRGWRRRLSMIGRVG
jgi:hypothetical protein